VGPERLKRLTRLAGVRVPSTSKRILLLPWWMDVYEVERIKEKSFVGSN